MDLSETDEEELARHDVKLEDGTIYNGLRKLRRHKKLRKRAYDMQQKKLKQQNESKEH